MYANLIRCQELFDELCYTQQLNPYKLDTFWFEDQVEWFVQLAKEFEKIENDNATNQSFDWVYETEEFFVGKIKERLA